MLLMRTIRLLPLLLIALGFPAWAGQRATYLQEGEPPMVVEVADNGAARVGERGGDTYSLLLKDDIYIVSRADGAWQSVKLADLTAAVHDAGHSSLFDMFEEEGVPEVSADFRIEDAGALRVAGRDGKAYRVYGMPGAIRGEAETIVVSDDAVLAPIGRALEQYLIGMMTASSGGADPDFANVLSIAAIRAIFALGTPLDLSGRLKFVKVETVEIPDSTVKHPIRPLTRAQLVAGLKAMKAAGAAPPR